MSAEERRREEEWVQKKEEVEDGVANGCIDQDEKEGDFPSSSWEIPPLSVQPARAVTHHYAPFLVSTVVTHADSQSAARSLSKRSLRTLLMKRPMTQTKPKSTFKIVCLMKL